MVHLVSLRNRVKTLSSPGGTSCQATRHNPKTPEYTVARNGFTGVSGTCRNIPALRSNIGRDC